MSIEVLVTVLAGVATALLGNVLFDITQRIIRRKRPPERIEDRVKRLTKSLEEATSLINNIEAEITARSNLVTQLQKDIDQYNKLVQLKKPEVEAVAQLLRGELKKENRGSFWKGFAVILSSLFLEQPLLGSSTLPRYLNSLLASL
ncbi:MAG: hypothetical protein AABN95_03325 [Acidobacteriota bacterium]